MKITVSDRYYHDADCDVADCECRYCKEHRMLWRDCDTAEETYDGAGQSWWELRDCPECQRDIKRPNPCAPLVLSSTPALITRSSALVVTLPKNCPIGPMS